MIHRYRYIGTGTYTLCMYVVLFLIDSFHTGQKLPKQKLEMLKSSPCPRSRSLLHNHSGLPLRQRGSHAEQRNRHHHLNLHQGLPLHPDDNQM